MHSRKLGSRGFTLIASLMLLLIMSGVAIGLLMMVNTESKAGGQDTQNSLAFHAAEGGIEHMTSDLSQMFQNIQSPTAAQIQALSASAPPGTPYMSYPVYTLTPATKADGSLATNFGKVSSGPYQDLYAQILPVTLQVTATTSLAGLGTLGDEVNMSRKVEVALVPVFQFGVFSDGDLSFFAGPNLDFAGRVHTNGDLYLLEGTGGTVRFHDKLTAYGNVIRWELPNGNTAAATAHLGSVDILTAALGCDLPARPNCRDMGADRFNAVDESSVLPGSAPNTWTTGGQNPAWPMTISGGDYGTWIIDGNYGVVPGGSGARKLSLPFINNSPGAPLPQPQPFEIIRRPPRGEVTTTPLGASRLYNEAEIRVLLSDDPNELPCGNPSVAPPCGGGGDANNIRLANVGPYALGVQATTPALPPLASGGNYMTYFAGGTTSYPDPSQWTGVPQPLGTVTKLPSAWPYAPLQPIPADITLTNDQGPPAAPLTTPVASANNYGLTQAPPSLNLTPCPGNPPVCPAPVPFYNPPYPYYLAAPVAQTNTWNLLDGYLRVEYRDVGGAYHPVTAEWLQLGFARGPVPPSGPASNIVNPNAILIFQEPADRNASGGLPDAVGAPPSCTKTGGVWTCIEAKPPEITVDVATKSTWYGDSKAAVQSPTMNNWYPINFYDSREGEPRDAVGGGPNTCTPAGIMNAVELDVGNLQRWLNGTIPGSGNLVDFVFQNGYVLYFSDRRGMLWNPNGTPPVGALNTKTGDSGLEDSINTVNASGAPDGRLEPPPPPLPPPVPVKPSPEDVNNNGLLDNFGGGNIGLGLGYVGALYTGATSINSLIRNAAGAPDPYLTAGRIQQCSIGQKNWISGARHVLKLVDGSLGQVPTMPVALNGSFGGFTVGSENPVYILGNYNSNCTAAGGVGCTPGNPNFDLTWLPQPPVQPEPVHSAAAVIADAVTLLSNNWSDLASFGSPTNIGGRIAGSTYYRVAVSGGKNMNFSVQGLGWAGGDFGTDGGLHNFLRLLEQWTNAAGVQQTLNYKGSLVSMYYSTYATGVDRDGGGTTYSPPVRNYTFDPLFTQPQNLPPGTPFFRDIDNLSYRQSFTPHTGCY
jgi:type II secretory pathway pseudopilin PulG